MATGPFYDVSAQHGAFRIGTRLQLAVVRRQRFALGLHHRWR